MHRQDRARHGYYTPRADFTGDDTFKYRVRLGITQPADYDYVVRLKVR